MATWDETAWVDIGGGVSITDLIDDDGARVGILERHVCAGGRLSRGSVPFSGELRWTVEREEPLTLSPSIACGHCPNHGFIRGGRWVAA